MKIYLSIVASFLALAPVEYAESVKGWEKLFVECSKETGGDLKALSRGSPNFDDPKMKCFLACLVKKKETMVDGKVVTEKIIENITKNQPILLSDSTKADMTEYAIIIANEGKDECEVGGAFEKCLFEKHSYKQK